VQPPPPVPRQQIPVQQQNLQQQGGFPVQGQQIRGPAPRLPVGGNIQYPGDPYYQQQRNLPNPNYNQSNNNELFDDDVDERRKQDSAEKILDAFERSFVNHGRSAIIPIKVKFIPEENNSNPKQLNHQQQQRNMNNNNNRYRSTSRRSNSSSSTWSSSVRSSSRRFEQKTVNIKFYFYEKGQSSDFVV
jgi:hypothetical protein